MSTRRRGAPAQPEVHRITSAPEPLADDLARRQRRYLWQMGVRVVCFVAAGLLWGHVPVAVSIVLLVAATVLPYVAVLLANAGRERRDEPGVFFEARELGAAPRHDELGGGR
ncbi:DUF3099 domain-containing protein [Cellulomonas wangsupingiae]|uniref:DUF3099 domain-containing protein n=1 Tax=Cellulomonas wangsupingiae TaxID=2968085 RepID=UPI001D0EB763|nr:DUF3099 domain-containing protein [Cellulomonas wangsupingiae]MCM0640382.1 DUF3099 domain-containing protein [Cellulomonas wangsupingiae]